jgi:hypothetical protein
MLHSLPPPDDVVALEVVPPDVALDVVAPSEPEENEPPEPDANDPLVLSPPLPVEVPVPSSLIEHATAWIALSRLRPIAVTSDDFMMTSMLQARSAYPAHASATFVPAQRRPAVELQPRNRSRVRGRIAGWSMQPGGSSRHRSATNQFVAIDAVPLATT